jgi:hypothetical protein
MAYDYPTNVSTFSGFASYINGVTCVGGSAGSCGWFWSLMVVGIFLISMIGFSLFNTKEEAITASAFICLVFSGLLRIIGLVGDTLLFVFVIMLAAGLMMMHLRGRGR